MTHTGVAAGDATVLWTQVAVLLLLARLLGAAARRLGQPPIVGSLVAGLVAGPSVFGQVWPAGFSWFRPGTELHAGLLAAVANFSLLILLIVLGAETDLPLIRRLGRPAAAVTAGSLVLPLAAGAAVAVLLPAGFLGRHHSRPAFVLLIAAAMAVSSLPVIARIMTEMNLTRRNVGQLSIAAATVNDVVGFVALAIATALVAGGGPKELAIAMIGLVVLVAVLATGGQRVVDLTLRRSRRDGPDIAAAVGICVTFMLVVAAVAQAFGIDAALGAFLAGVVVGRSRFVPSRALSAIQWCSDAVFAPLYFATAGVSVDVTLLGRGSALGWFVLVLVVAVVSKVIGAWGGARLAKVPSRDAGALGIALNGRGALQVILATAGLTSGILSPTAFAVVILLSIASSIAVPPTLRRVLHDWQGTPEEQERLQHEEEMATNVVVRGQRLLLPSRGGTNSAAAARILDLAWPQSSAVTLLRVTTTDRDESGLDLVRASFGEREVREESVDADSVVEAILKEANLGYGAIGIGAAEHPSPDRMLPRFVEELLNQTPIPLVLVRRGADVVDDSGRPVLRPRRILVPITGNAASRAGQEVAQTISRNTSASLSLVHIVTRSSDGKARTERKRAGGVASATAVVEEATQQAREKQVDADVVLRDAAFSGDEIEREAERLDVDLVVVGTTVRRFADRPFLGHTVEHLIEHVTRPTVVVVVLPDAQQVVADEHIDRAAG